MVNKDMNGFPVKKCSAFQFFKKRVRRWIKSPMVSVDKHQSPNLKYTGPAGVHLPPGESDFEAMCQSCLGDHAFQRGMLPPEESCSWEIQPGCEVKEQCNHANILTKPDPRTFWTNDDAGPWPHSKDGVKLTLQSHRPTCCCYLDFHSSKNALDSSTLPLINT
ncbi:mCG2833 [Mus musculus]|nr:mCG2833 [Mus musculus]